ncbi:hypothetical protein RR48_01630 [Papilio machaon]|uniref:Uncharacterized protein n=1 Tax=Papilio machaon TaxID=76193 RepID=A0A0N1PIY0_PAPMA|nr:hypothetical protein RR48_01630 [Papilio machaon]
MAFSLRKMLTNISYFKKSDNETEDTKKQNTYDTLDEVNYENTEPDSTVRQCSSLNIPDSVKQFTAKKGSLSDTDLLTLNVDSPIRHKHKRCKKLKLDIKKASQSLSEKLNQEEENSCDSNVENTPKHILLECATSEFTDKLKGFDFSKEFDIYDGTSDDQWSNPFEEENIDIESISEHSDSDVSIGNKKKSIKMCRKVQSLPSGSSSDENCHPPSSPESFGDIETDKSEIERLKLLYNYQTKLEKVENLLKDMLNEFQFHIKVSKVFNSRADHEEADSNNPDMTRKPSPTDSWSVIMEKEDDNTKVSVKKQLESIKQSIEQFINVYLKDYDNVQRIKKCRKYLPRNQRGALPRRVNKKKMKHYDFPDLRDALINLFYPDLNDTFTSTTSDSDDCVSSKCSCSCHHESSSHTDSGLISKTIDGSSNQSITSSIGKEIQPSTVLNPMKMYRDDNKIVCFGNAVYACSLCFENDIIGESVLMKHCADKEHIERREKLDEIID